MAEKSAQHRNITQNKKAWHDYFVDEKIEAGIELFGTEVKSLRMVLKFQIKIVRL